MPSSLAESSATKSSSPIPTVDPASLVFHVDILCLVVLVVLVAFSAPRAVARVANRNEWSWGILRSVPRARQPRINLNTNSIYLHSDPQNTVLNLDSTSSENGHTQGLSYLPTLSSHNEKALPPRPVTPVVVQQTWHMPMLSSLVPPVAHLLQRRVLDNYSLGQVLLMAGYSIVILYAGLYQSNPFVDFDRSGWVSTSQLPLIYILASKNNVIGTLLGLGYEKLNYLHRFAGLFAVLATNVHAIGYFYQWSIAGEFSAYISKPSTAWGLVALICLDVLAFFSMQSVRSRFYNAFLATHVVGSIVVLFAVCYHKPVCVPYVIAACVFYGLDHLVRTIKTRITTATLRPIPELGLTRVEMPSINVGWRAGQHVRLRVLSTAMGIWGMTEAHPFTIASVSETDEGLVLLCKKAGRWTTKMYEMANTSTYGDHGRDLGRTAKVMVEGPYGGVGHTVMSSYSGAMFVVGGSGVTFALSAVQDLVRLGNASDVTDIDIVWSVPDVGSLAPMIPLFAALASQSTAARLRVSVYYTRASKRSPLDGAHAYLPPGLALHAGRPDLSKHLDVLVNSARCAGGCSGVFVGTCGPTSLAASASEAVRTFDVQRGRAVGGVEFHEEVFGW